MKAFACIPLRIGALIKAQFFVFMLLYGCSSLPTTRSQIAKHLQRPLSEQVQPFRSDACSFWPEGTKKDSDLWLSCCVVHDLAYWKGGTRKEKKMADEKLQLCVEEKYGSGTAQVMRWGVETGGRPIFDTDFKWAYGWNYQRGYLPLTDEEKKYLKTISPKAGERLRDYVDWDALPLEKEDTAPIRLR